MMRFSLLGLDFLRRNRSPEAMPRPCLQWFLSRWPLPQWHLVRLAKSRVISDLLLQCTISRTKDVLLPLGSQTRSQLLTTTPVGHFSFHERQL
ncbi:hypothetical protein BDZ45DRAFT_349057 [Acephala macrosclerotiorum]|nr:hypothetical protein BDZ45DRAFT_349057 [Acephala macrosclerotiorum]